MGWAARANWNVQSMQRGDLKREPSKPITVGRVSLVPFHSGYEGASFGHALMIPALVALVGRAKQRRGR